MNDQTKSITLRLPVVTIQYLQRLARSESLDKADDIAYTDLIRRAINNQYCWSPAALMSDAEKVKTAFEMSRCDDD